MPWHALSGEGIDHSGEQYKMRLSVRATFAAKSLAVDFTRMPFAEQAQWDAVCCSIFQPRKGVTLHYVTLVNLCLLLRALWRLATAFLRQRAVPACLSFALCKNAKGMWPVCSFFLVPASVIHVIGRPCPPDSGLYAGTDTFELG